MKQIPASLLPLLTGVLITLISLWVGQHHGLLPEQASEQAPLVDQFFNVMVTIATALFLVVQGAIVLFIIQFRRRAGDDTDGVAIKGSFPLEILWTAIPAVIVICRHYLNCFVQSAIHSHPVLNRCKSVLALTNLPMNHPCPGMTCPTRSNAC
ncbi:MAG: hypothetical protein HC833_01655 [Leptolyngbyaceae cyanobacterium RM1_406_9]|nr:hypothetical protein [Leptolyngbyaceae cyanobacterium RM1_406_9]